MSVGRVVDRVCSLLPLVAPLAQAGRRAMRLHERCDHEAVLFGERVDKQYKPRATPPLFRRSKAVSAALVMNAAPHDALAATPLTN